MQAGAFRIRQRGRTTSLIGGGVMLLLCSPGDDVSTRYPGGLRSPSTFSRMKMTAITMKAKVRMLPPMRKIQLSPAARSRTATATQTTTELRARCSGPGGGCSTPVLSGATILRGSSGRGSFAVLTDSGSHGGRTWLPAIRACVFVGLDVKFIPGWFVLVIEAARDQANWIRAWRRWNWKP